VRATAEEREDILSGATCSVEDAARVLGIGRSGGYKAVNSGELRSIRINGRVLVPTAAIKEPTGCSIGAGQ
jgi:excisionase family DNA binding protein